MLDGSLVAVSGAGTRVVLDTGGTFPVNTCHWSNCSSLASGLWSSAEDSELLSGSMRINGKTGFLNTWRESNIYSVVYLQLLYQSSDEIGEVDNWVNAYDPPNLHQPFPLVTATEQGTEELHSLLKQLHSIPMRLFILITNVLGIPFHRYRRIGIQRTSQSIEVRRKTEMHQCDTSTIMISNLTAFLLNIICMQN